MSPHETFVQYLKISIAVFALIFVIGWGLRVTNLLQEIVTLQQLNNEVLNLYMNK